MKLYHGTNYSAAINICQSGIDLSYSQAYLDFGKGFYTTPEYSHAAVTAIRKTNKYNRMHQTTEQPYIVEVDCNFNYNKILKIKQFPTHSKEWGEFVIFNRLWDEVLDKLKSDNHNRDNKYDIVYGEIADGSVVNISYEINNNLRKADDIHIDKLLKNGKLIYGHQYSFHTDQSLECITKIKCHTIFNRSKFEKLIHERSR